MTRQQFLKVYLKYQPNHYTIAVYELWQEESKTMGIGMGLIFLFGFISKIIGANCAAGMAGVSLAMILLFITGISLPAWIMNKRRINKIIKELGITPQAYNAYIKMYV